MEVSVVPIHGQCHYGRIKVTIAEMVSASYFKHLHPTLVQILNRLIGSNYTRLVVQESLANIKTVLSFQNSRQLLFSICDENQALV